MRSRRRVDIGRVHDVHRTGFEGEQIEHVEIMQHPVGDTACVSARHARFRLAGCAFSGQVLNLLAAMQRFSSSHPTCQGFPRHTTSPYARGIVRCHRKASVNMDFRPWLSADGLDKWGCASR